MIDRHSTQSGKEHPSMSTAKANICMAAGLVGGEIHT
jgi:hypothetical protein